MQTIKINSYSSILKYNIFNFLIPVYCSWTNFWFINTFLQTNTMQFLIFFINIFTDILKQKIIFYFFTFIFCGCVLSNVLCSFELVHACLWDCWQPTNIRPAVLLYSKPSIWTPLTDSVNNAPLHMRSILTQISLFAHPIYEDCGVTTVYVEVGRSVFALHCICVCSVKVYERGE